VLRKYEPKTAEKRREERKRGKTDWMCWGDNGSRGGKKGSLVASREGTGVEGRERVESEHEDRVD